MAKTGLKEFLGQGTRYFTSAVASVYVGLRLSADPSSSFYINLLTSLPTSGTEALTIDSAGNMGRQALGGGGTVTSVSTGNLAPLFTASIANPNTTPALSFSLSTQAVNTVFAGPGSGGSAAPTFRALVANDIPALTASKISDFDTQVRTSRLDQFAAPTGNLNFGGFKGTNLADGLNYADIATWGQVQALFNGSDNKANARVASTAALALTSATTTTITMSGGMPTTLDGVALAASDRLLIKDQSGAGATGAAANGLYVYSAGTTWTRATDADISAETTSGLFVFVSEGTANGSNGYTLTTADPIVLGTTQLTFIQTSGAGQILAGAGLTKTGNLIDIVGTANRITANADSLDIASTYVGQTSITTLGTIGTGTWQGTAVAVAFGGTGANNAASARSNLSAAGIYRLAFTSADLVAGVLPVTHGLAAYPIVQVVDNNNKLIEPDDVLGLNNATTCSVDLTSYAATMTGTYRVMVAG